MEELLYLLQIENNFNQMIKLKRNEKQKLFLKSKKIFQAAFFYVRILKINTLEKKTKDIIVVPKKCGNAVLRNYIRRITKILIKKYKFNLLCMNFLFIYEKKKIENINYKTIENNIISLYHLFNKYYAFKIL
jgi:ribonuclease P protein component